jgi:outer membrane protein OmpA-like peptidoglycan-associated protein/uncharacterized surface protein with fasciclin (FAS1) repeats
MSTPPRSVSRYQRRILGWGIGVACLLFVVGAPIYLDRIESDLNGRVAEALTDAGFAGFTVSFSGQTGAIECNQPFGDPQLALDIAYDVRGVHAIDDLPDACRVRTVVEDDVDTATTNPATTVPDDTTPESTTSATVPVDFESVAAVIAGSPQFALLQQLVEEAGIGETLAGERPLTMFAPIDAAFDRLSADELAQLRSDPEVLASVLVHHLVPQRLTVSQLRPGPLTPVSGDALTVGEGDPPTVDGSAIVEADVLAVNGIVHAIDGLLLPADVDLTAPIPLESVVVEFDGGAMSLDGVVRSEVERTILLEAATAAVGAGQVTDTLTTDPEVGLDEPTAESLAALVAAMPGNLTSGTAGFDGTDLYVVGTYVDEAGRDAIAAVASEVEATVELAPPPDATTGGEDAAGEAAAAAALEAELNAVVAATPIVFEPGGGVLDVGATPILDAIAGLLDGVAGVVIVVEGHTDSDGITDENLALSLIRAQAVRQALVERGVDGGSIAAEGFGSTVPVLVDGVEDKAASRRVEFRVEVAT